MNLRYHGGHLGFQGIRVLRDVVLAAPDRVNIPRLTHDTRLCQFDVKMAYN